MQLDVLVRRARQTNHGEDIHEHALHETFALVCQNALARARARVVELRERLVVRNRGRHGIISHAHVACCEEFLPFMGSRQLQKTLVACKRHSQIQIVIPRDKALVTHGANKRAVRQPIC